MRTITENIAALRQDLARPLQFLKEASDLCATNWDRAPLMIGGVPFTVIGGATFAWRDLDVDAKRMRSKFLDDYNHLFELVRALLRSQPSEVIAKLEEGDKEIRDLAGQASRIRYSTKEEAFSAIDRRLDQMLEVVGYLHDASEGSCLILPDTNALLYNPHLEQWRFPEVRDFAIVLLPTVLEELDEIKVHYRNPEVREKAESLIRRIGEYGRRGELHEGVPLVRGVSTIRAVAPEPRQTLSWLDLSINDDRILSSYIEVMRANPRSIATLVTRDGNLKNKVRFARLDFEEPPEPPSGG